MISNPRHNELFHIIADTSGMAGCGTTGNVAMGYHLFSVAQNVSTEREGSNTPDHPGSILLQIWFGSGSAKKGRLIKPINMHENHLKQFLHREHGENNETETKIVAGDVAHKEIFFKARASAWGKIGDRQHY
jgi:hypothetical protein